MNRISTFLCFTLIVLSTSLLTGQQEISKNIYFNSDTYILDEEGKKELKDFALSVKNYTESDIRIVGHTDQDGSKAYNLSLSKKRAEKVHEFLQNEGIEQEDIALGYLEKSN